MTGMGTVRLSGDGAIKAFGKLVNDRRMLRIGLFVASLLLTGQAMAQGVRWEDYRGSASVTGTTYTGPAGAPTFNNNPASPGDPVPT